MNPEFLVLGCGAATLGLTACCTRCRALGERQAVLWVLVALALLLCAAYPGLAVALAESFQLSSQTTLGYALLAGVYLLAFSVSIALTRQDRRTIRLMQHIALLEMQLRQLRPTAPAPNPPVRHNRDAPVLATAAGSGN